jgi:hypothetical protein
MINNQQKKNTNDSERDQINKKLDLLRNKVLSKHIRLTNEQRQRLKEKRLNTIFDKNNYYNIDNELTKRNEITRNKNNSFLMKEKANNKFLEKYKELYNLSKNKRNNNNNEYRIKNNVDNQCKSNKSQTKIQIKMKYDELFDNYLKNEKSKDDIFNSSMKSIKTNIIKNSNFLNSLLKNKNVININFIDNLNNNKINIFSNTIRNGSGVTKGAKFPKNYSFNENKKESIVNKMLNEFDKASGSQRNNNYFNKYNYDRPASSSRIYNKKPNYNILYRNIVNNPFNSMKRLKKNNTTNNYLYDQHKKSIELKLDHFKARLNLLS